VLPAFCILGAPETITSVMRNDSQLFFLGVVLSVELAKAGPFAVWAICRMKKQLPNDQPEQY
jgi:hypothetical protein